MLCQVEVVKTSAGDQTLYLKELDETYHSRHGAISESQHVFIEQGLNRLEHLGQLQILEVGFGTGLNALLTFLKSGEALKIDYTTLEPFPIQSSLVKQLNYGAALQAQKRFLELHQSAWETPIMLTNNFTITKLKSKLEDINLELNQFDLVYFDAFASSKQPELWDITIFEKLFQSLKSVGILTTYAAPGHLKRNLRSCGFRLLHPQGANGKREMTVAIK